MNASTHCHHPDGLERIGFGRRGWLTASLAKESVKMLLTFVLVGKLKVELAFGDEISLQNIRQQNL